MRTRIFRALVCLVLVAALLVQVSPIRARATGPNFFFVDPELQLASDLIGLGVSTGADSLAHTQVIQDAADWLAETGDWLSEGMLKVYKVAAAAGGFKYMVDGDFLQELFEWMFDTEVVNSSIDLSGIEHSLVPNGTFVEKGESVYLCMDGTKEIYATSVYGDGFWLYRIHGQYYSGGGDKLLNVFLHEGGRGNYVEVNGSSCYSQGSVTIDDKTYYYYHNQIDVSDMYDKAGAAWVSYDGSMLELNSDKIKEYIVGCVKDIYPITSFVDTDKDLTLNHVGAFGSILPDSYPEWFQNSTTITDSETGEEKTVVPVAIGQTVTETQGMSQTDVWAGTSTYVDTETDIGTGDDTVTVPETVTLKDILTGILSVPKSIAQAVAAFFADVVAAVKAIPAAITEFFTISADVSAFAIEWRDFFPFCIPFDIYDFLTLLMAEPEAPKFEWEIDLLKTGEPYLMVVEF